MRSDHPDPAERQLLAAEDLALAALLTQHLADPDPGPRDELLGRAVLALGPAAGRSLNAAIALYEALNPLMPTPSQGAHR